MLRRRFVRENPEAVRDGLDLRHNDDVDLDAILELDAEWRELKAEGDDLRRQRNEISSRIGELKQEGRDDDAREAIERSQELKAEIDRVEERADELDDELEARLLELPNVPHEDTPPGEDESDNVEVRREFFADHDAPADPVPHYDLGEELNIFNS